MKFRKDQEGDDSSERSMEDANEANDRNRIQANLGLVPVLSVVGQIATIGW